MESAAVWFWFIFRAFWVLVGGWALLVFVILPIHDRIRGRRPPRAKTFENAGWYPDLSEEEAVSKAALYFRWCAQARLVSDDHIEDEESAPHLGRMVSGDLSASEYLMKNTGGKLSSMDLNDEGDAFTRAFFPRRFDAVLDELAPGYRLEADVDFGLLAARLDDELDTFRKRARARKRL
jgi:hypothetical protein